jgi:hypothetical protein
VLRLARRFQAVVAVDGARFEIALSRKLMTVSGDRFLPPH